MYAQCDIDGNQNFMTNWTVDYKNDINNVSMNNIYKIVKDRKYLSKTTKGWHMFVNLRDGSST